MAYADYEFYKTSFFGNVVPESDFNRFSERASDFIDMLTFDRLAANPDHTPHLSRLGRVQRNGVRYMPPPEIYRKRTTYS